MTTVGFTPPRIKAVSPTEGARLFPELILYFLELWFRVMPVQIADFLQAAAASSLESYVVLPISPVRRYPDFSE